MTPEQRRFSRRALFVGAGAATAYGIVRLLELDPSTRAPQPGAPTSTAAPETGRAVDLSVRWRHLVALADVPGLAAGWTFDETAGYSFGDVTGNGHDLFITGSRWNTTDSGLAGAIHRQGLRGGAVYLDGTRWLEADTAPGLAGGGGLTVSCRVRRDVLVGAPVLLQYGSGYRLGLDADGSASFTVTDVSGTAHAIRSTGGPLPLGRWSHLSAVVSPAGGQLALYVDGRLDARRTVPHLRMRPAAQRVLLGRGLVGAVDEATVHVEALSADDVRRLHVVGMPKVFTQTSESVDTERSVFTRFKGSDPVPHPVVSGTVMTIRFADSTSTDQGHAPVAGGVRATFAPGAFGGGWQAVAGPLPYRSPLTGDSGSLEAWFQPLTDPSDPHRVRRKEFFSAVGASSALTLYTQDGRWHVEVRRRSHATVTRTARAPRLIPGALGHVGLTWGSQPGGGRGVVLYVDGVPAGFVPTGAGETTYGDRVVFGGTADAPAHCLLDDVRLSDHALPAAEICPRGQAAAGAAGLDLRDRFNRPPGAAPMLWRPGSPGGAWSHQELAWERPAEVGEDPHSRRALYQASTTGVQTAYHPDAFGHASSIEAGVAFPEAADGWAGLFVHSPRIGGGFAGMTFMLNPGLGMLRLARFADGRVTSAKELPHDFAVAARTTYELTLTCAGDGIVRGFVDGSNVISMRAEPARPAQGFAGMLTDGAAAFFRNLHFTALTPASPQSRVVRTRVIRYGSGARVGALELGPFRWHKRPGLLPWQYDRKRPEPPGNIAGAATALPPRPIGSAAWRSEDSANSALITVDQRVLYFMRGNPRIDDRAGSARVGVLYADVAAFDGVHFVDPNAASAALTGGTILTASGQTPALQLNAPSAAYVGNGRLLFLGRAYATGRSGAAPFDAVEFSRYDARTDTWESAQARPMSWGRAPDAVPPSAQPTSRPTSQPSSQPSSRSIHGSPELVALRNPDTDDYQAVVFLQSGAPKSAVMTTALLDRVGAGVPVLAAGQPLHTSLTRPSGRAIYGFRVLFDNGIYYLHYNEGPHVPDWPQRFVLASALDPFAGPWVASATTLPESSTYFRRGTAFAPDNGAIWQGAMFKHRGCYYLYYENYHSTGDVNAPYRNYDDPQAGSRVGFATA